MTIVKLEILSVQGKELNLTVASFLISIKLEVFQVS